MRTGLVTGLHTGIRSGINPSDGGGVVTSPFPESAEQWAASFPTVVGPAAIHTMQDTEFPIQDHIGDSDLLAGTTPPSLGGTGDPLGRKSLVFSGGNNYTQSPALPLAAGDFSVWMRLQSAVPASNDYIASTGSIDLIAQRLSSGVYRVGMNDGVNGYTFASAPASDDEGWHDFLFTRSVSTKTITLWIDGDSYTGTGESVTGDLSALTYEIGRSSNGLSMEISYHAVFGYALSSEDWSAILAARAE